MASLTTPFDQGANDFRPSIVQFVGSTSSATSCTYTVPEGASVIVIELIAPGGGGGAGGVGSNAQNIAGGGGGAAGGYAIGNFPVAALTSTTNRNITFTIPQSGQGGASGTTATGANGTTGSPIVINSNGVVLSTQNGAGGGTGGGIASAGTGGTPGGGVLSSIGGQIGRASCRERVYVLV